MAKKLISHADLTRGTASAKRTFIRRAQKGKYLTKKLSKEEVLQRIASTLQLTSRSLYTGDRKLYLEKWYQTLLFEIDEIHEELRVKKNLSSVKELKNLTVEQLMEEVSDLKQMLMAYQTKCEEQALVIEKMMKQVVKRHERV
jgi:ribosomal protein L29